MLIILATLFVSIEVSIGQNSFVQPYPEGNNHPCGPKLGGPCTIRPRKCEYQFDVELYLSLSQACYNCPSNTTDCNRYNCVPVDGFSRPVQVVNRLLPGPSIQVCHGDEVIVNVHNIMKSETTSIHFHGIHQLTTPYSDGVPFVTQCPINPETRFQYRFRADQYGTHLWHSHSGLERGNGIAGSLIVRRAPDIDSHGLYHHDLPEHIVFLQDWTENEANEVFIKRYFDALDEFPRTILVNGRATFVSGVNGGTGGIPMPKFTVSKDLKYRFRFISAAFMDTPIEISIDDHKMLVIATDGADIVPVETDVLTIYAGERWDVVIHANKLVNNYLMRYRGLVMGELGSAFQATWLQYSGAPNPVTPDLTYATSGSPLTNPIQVNGFLDPPNNIPVDNLRNYYGFNAGGVVTRFYISFDIEEVYDKRFQLMEPKPNPNEVLTPLSQVPRLNNIALEMKPFPLLSQATTATQAEYCTSVNSTTCSNNTCFCLHVIQLTLGNVYEMVFIDRGKIFDVAHPIHLHGHYFSIVGMGRLGNQTTDENVRQLDNTGRLRRNFLNNIEKDTVLVPDGGYTIVRFRANNPGFWLMHCHLDFHSELGMGLIFQSGTLAQIRTQRPVPINFPRCGDYVTAPPP